MKTFDDSTTLEARLVLSPAALEELAERTARLLRDSFVPEMAFGQAFLSVPEAAALMRAKPQRIYDLLSSGRLTRYKDGRRVLLERSEILSYLSGGSREPLAPRLPPASQSRIRSGTRP